jgi:hypothetical protein
MITRGTRAIEEASEGGINIKNRRMSKTFL